MIIYSKSLSRFTASSIILNSDLKTDNLEIEGILNSDDIKEEDVLSGKYDFANIEIFLVNYKDLSQGRINLHSETLGKVTLNNGRFIVEIRALSAKLEEAQQNYILLHAEHNFAMTGVKPMPKSLVE
ncbi:baseplate hub domain-containing protein [Wolbachia pipientis]|uniref:baseplate hub domain-containing protein n=1 Tax=Wolbachia pipientis TaxID=955 RepID=UPI0025A350E9|nr:DUF2163 domain-containing protein [Wolbachia pipientis]MDM8335295.1 DUF2163 domain-containing protein [Wolbachia pipientis]